MQEFGISKIFDGLKYFGVVGVRKNGGCEDTSIDIRDKKEEWAEDRSLWDSKM